MHNITNSTYATETQPPNANPSASNMMLTNNIFSGVTAHSLQPHDEQTRQFFEQLAYLVVSESFVANTLTRFHSQIGSTTKPRIITVWAINCHKAKVASSW